MRSRRAPGLVRVNNVFTEAREADNPSAAYKCTVVTPSTFAMTAKSEPIEVLTSVAEFAVGARVVPVILVRKCRGRGECRLVSG